MKTVLVTGGAGFIGSHVVESLLSEGFRVIVADNLSTGVRENVSSDAELFVIDILDCEFSSLVAQVRPNSIVHLAAQVSVAKSVEDPVFDADVNVTGTLRVLEAARTHGVERFIFASSAAVYGVPNSLPLREDAPLHPISPYGVAKASAEAYVRTYCNLYGLKAVVMRYSNVFGPRQSVSGDGGVVARFIDAILRGRAPTLYGDGSQTRDFIYVKDVAKAVIKALDYLDGASRSHCLVANISSCRETSIRELLSLLRTMLKQTPAPVIAAAREGDIQHSCLDNRRAHECLGWTPAYSLEEALRETVAAACFMWQESMS